MPTRPATLVHDVLPTAGSGRAAKLPAMTARPDATVATVRRSRFMAIVRSNELSWSVSGSSCRRWEISSSTTPRARSQDNQRRSQPGGQFDAGDPPVAADGPESFRILPD